MTSTAPTEPHQFGYWGPADAKPEEVIDHLLHPPSLVAVDIETISLKNRSIIGIGVATAADEAFYLPVAPTTSPYVVDAVRRVICNPDVRKVYHNAMFDLGVLYTWGADATNVADTSVMASLCGLPRGLKELAAALLEMDIREVSDVLPRGATMLDVPYPTLASKCIDDVLATYRLYEVLAQHVDTAYLAAEMALIPILLRMSKRGIKLDQELCSRLEVKLQQEVDYYRSLAEGEGFNPASPQQVAYVLMQRGNHLPMGRGKAGYKVDTSEKVLRTLRDPMAAVVLNYRKVAKLLSTYITPWAGEERAYTEFHLGTDTGRLASRNRNLQNIPSREDTGKEVRHMFLPDSGQFTDIDCSQQELRALAYLSQDPDMLYVYEKGLDIHQDTADFMGIQRKVAKNVTFAMIYGGSAETVMETAGISNLARARQLRELWFRRFPTAGKWIEDTGRQGLEDRKVYTIGGRPLYLPQSWEENDAGVMRKAVNYRIQGSAAEITKEAVRRCWYMDLVLQVHDELLIDGHVSEEEVGELGLEDLAPFKTPWSVEHMERWE